MYYTYMLRCKDGSIYTGFTSDIKRRMEEHFEKNEKCAKYTLTHDAIKLESVWKSNSRQLSLKLEYWIKHLSKKQKESLIKDNNLLEKFLGEKLEINEYQSLNIDVLLLK